MKMPPVDSRMLRRHSHTLNINLQQVNEENCSRHSFERRGPSNSDSGDREVVSSSSHCSRVNATASFDTLESSENKKSSSFSSSQSKSLQVVPEAEVKVKIDPALRAIELIRELSFETTSVTPSSVPEKERTFASSDFKSSTHSSSSTPSSDSEELTTLHLSTADHQVFHDEVIPSNEYDDDGAVCKPVRLHVEINDHDHDNEDIPLPPPLLLDRMSPPLPPKINRISSSYPMSPPPPIGSNNNVPCQIMNHRNRTRSTSISEMSDSYCFNEFVNVDDDDNRSYSTCSSKNEDGREGGEKEEHRSCGWTMEKKSLITIEQSVLPASAAGTLSIRSLSPRRSSSLWNRKRTSSYASDCDQSSYVSSASSSNHLLSIATPELEEEMTMSECCNQGCDKNNNNSNIHDVDDENCCRKEEIGYIMSSPQEGMDEIVGYLSPQEGKPSSSSSSSCRKNHRGQSSRTIVSDVSSYVSSASSSSDEFSIDSRVEEVEDVKGRWDDYVDIDVPDRCPNQEIGHLSLQEGKCNTYHEYDDDDDDNNIIVDSTTDPKVVPRLTSDTLREWNAICQEEYASKNDPYWYNTAKNQFIFRALSCPCKISAAANCPEREPTRMDSYPTDDNEGDVDADDDFPVEEPHMMDVISQSLFSYTNSGYSGCGGDAPSTISSHKENNNESEMDVSSDLDFDMAFIYSCSVEKSPVGTPLDGGCGGTATVDRLGKSRRSSCTYSIEKSSVGTPFEGSDRLSKSHRRSLSSGSRRLVDGKPILAVPKQPIVLTEDTPPTTWPLLKNKVPPPRSMHRRFKSDGSIFCKKQQSLLLSQMDFSFMGGPSFKNKCSNNNVNSNNGSNVHNIRHQHHRGRSLDFNKEPQIIDCSPLQSILEVLEEASKSSRSSGDHGRKHSASSSSPGANLIDFLKEHLFENLSAMQLLTLGFLLGLFVGLVIPHAIAVIL